VIRLSRRGINCYVIHSGIYKARGYPHGALKDPLGLFQAPKGEEANAMVVTNPRRAF
jgi:hypothetical protein